MMILCKPYTSNMQGDMHFTHHHPLSFFVDKHVEDYEDYKSDTCKICGLPILSTPSYICSSGCGFFLQKCCAETFPQQFIHPSHGLDLLGKKHSLRLQQGSPNFTYQCEDCSFQIHPLVAVPRVEIKTKHRSHPSHPLVAVCKQNSCECDACGKKHDGFFFSCHLCNFWIHQDCTMLPSVVTIASRPQPFLLTYSLPTNQRDHNCVICHEPLFLIHNAIYYCPPVAIFAHVSCAMEKIQSKTRLELIQLPDDDWEASPSSVIRGYSQSNRLQLLPDADDGQDDKLTIEKFHDHPLIPVPVGDDEKISSSQETCVPELCDVCIQTITVSSPFYRCALQLEKGCRFLAHKICADLLPIIKFAIPVGHEATVTAQLCPNPSDWFFNAIFLCLFCHLPCNGPCYYLPFHTIPEPVNLPFFIDVECMAAPSIIRHASHSQHLLYRTSRYSNAHPISCCATDSIIYDVYRCFLCRFYIHVRCAFLPKRLRHEFDKHPLDLITTTGEGVDLCEVCETSLDLGYWHYYCRECEQSYHINCISKTGYLSKVKFGGTLGVSYHKHPLALTRMLSVGRNEKCGHCNNIILGFVDEMVFCCSQQCGFWVHFSCARDSTASKPRIFSEVDEKIAAAMAKRDE